VLEEGSNEWRVEIFDLQLRRCFASPLMDEGEQTPKRVALGGHGVRAGLPLLG